ncbi:hypothetical protein F4778DRAFT_741765 [Xylariomycetidae sp. FL2044]|nr:hypothetical protein F4778DRAFT_741765 [Xylariomycetidae sp. FL2044]
MAPPMLTHVLHKRAGFKWKSCMGTSLIGSRECRMIVFALQQSTREELDPDFVIQRFTRLFTTALENIDVCGNIDPVSFWGHVGSQIRWVNRFPGLTADILYQFSQAIMTARTEWLELVHWFVEQELISPVQGLEERRDNEPFPLAVDTFVKKILTCEKLDTATRDLYVPPFTQNPPEDDDPEDNIREWHHKAGLPYTGIKEPSYGYWIEKTPDGPVGETAENQKVGHPVEDTAEKYDADGDMDMDGEMDIEDTAMGMDMDMDMDTGKDDGQDVNKAEEEVVPQFGQLMSLAFRPKKT